MPENDVEQMTFRERATALGIGDDEIRSHTGLNLRTWKNDTATSAQASQEIAIYRNILDGYLKGRESEAARHKAESKNDDGWPKSEPEKPRDMTERRVALGLSLSQVTEIIHSRPEEATYDSQFAALYNLLEAWQAKIDAANAQIDRLGWRITELLTSSKKSEDRLRRLLAYISEASQ
jgi:hypothetical protein